jgi:hypothetical protein
MMGSCDAKVAVMAVDALSLPETALLPKRGTEHFIGRSV